MGNIVLGVDLLAEALIRIRLVTAGDAVVTSILVLVLGAVVIYLSHEARSHPSTAVPPRVQP